MEINSSHNENQHFCIWDENKIFFVEAMGKNIVLPLHLSHLVWFKDSFVELSSLLSSFCKRDRDAFGAVSIQKIKINFSCHVELVIWPIFGGRKNIMAPAGRIKMAGMHFEI